MGTKRARKEKGDSNEKGKHPKKSNEKKPIPTESILDTNYVEYQSDDDIHPLENANDNQPVANDNQESSSSDEDDDMNEGEIDLNEIEGEESDVELTIEFFDPKPEAVTTISMFLKGFSSGFETTREKSSKLSNIDTRALSETICAQTRVGTCIHVTDEDSPIGFISCLNVRTHQQLLTPIKQKLLDVCKGKKEHDPFAELIKRTFDGEGKRQSEKMGLVMSGRVMNLPPSVIPKMLEALFCEIEWAIEDEPTKELRESYKFGWYLYITDVFTGKMNQTEVGSGKDKSIPEKKKAQDGNQEIGESELIYTKIEDEIWAQYAKYSITWSTQSNSEEGNVPKKRLALLVPASKISRIRKTIEEIVNVDVEGEEDEGEAS